LLDALAQDERTADSLLFSTNTNLTKNKKTALAFGCAAFFTFLNGMRLIAIVFTFNGADGETRTRTAFATTPSR
jgi:hypothetical protein